MPSLNGVLHYSMAQHWLETLLGVARSHFGDVYNIPSELDYLIRIHAADVIGYCA